MLPLHHAPKCRRYYTPILRSCQFFLDDFSNFRCQSCIIKKGQSGRASPGKRDVKLWGGEDGSRKGSIGGDGRARGNDFCGFALEGWPFCRLYGIVMVLRRGMEVENGRNEAELRCTALAGAGAIYFGGHISPDGSRDGVATVCHLLFIDEFHLYWHGDGVGVFVGVFHFATNSASARAEMATVGLRNDGALAIFARGEVSFFSRRMPLPGGYGIYIMFRRFLRRFSAYLPPCSWGGGRMRRFPPVGIFCSYQRRC